MFYRRAIIICLIVTTFAAQSKVDDDDNDDEKNVLDQKQQQQQPKSPTELQPKSPKSPLLTTLANSDECKADVQRYCAKGAPKQIPNLKVLECIDDLDNAVNLISKECQNRLYIFKYNMTHNVRFDDAASKFCEKDIKLLEDCNEQKDDRGTGRLVSCLYDLSKNITDPACRNFIQRIHSVIFTDWRFSESFADACINDITERKCGRLDDEKNTLPHDQGAVISCLSKKQKKLTPPCLKQISRLIEMQSDDYHLDRALYMACREDRDRLCAQVISGNGRVYRCLFEQKFNSMMSTDCRKEVHRRQSMIVSNALLDAPLLRACRSEMSEHKCVADSDDPDKQVTLINLLLCLEDRIKKGNQIKDDCQREMLGYRRVLMSDYALSPEIISRCKGEMIQHCPAFYQKGASGSIDQRGGRMLHCLMKAAGKEKNFSSSCLASVKSLVRAVDPGNDIRADPLLETACRPVIEILCQKIKPGDSNIIMCLLDNLKNTRMSAECEERLMEVTYFMARDWRLTPKLLQSCRNNLNKQCGLPRNWTMQSEMDDVAVGTYLSCLYEQKQQLDKECRDELLRLMRIRSQTIGLMPEIEDKCITDLATCKNPQVKGEEMKCLQKKYNDLEDECKVAVRDFTKRTMADPSLDFLLMKACEPVIQLFCSNIGKGKENELIRCLIKHKNDQKMNFRCKSGIEHHQILSLKDKAFLSDRFKEKCKKEIGEHCSEKKTKSTVIQCLANLVLQDDLLKKTQIKEDCRDELKFELLQRSESINFDPSLAKACAVDIRQFCSTEIAGNAQVIDCLKKNHQKVSGTCFAKLRKREKLDVVLPGNDFSLTSKCAAVIQKHCSNEKKQNILLCLRRHANEDTMPIACRQVLFHRLMVLNTNVNFNKGLIDNCKNDITKHCGSVVVDDDDDSNDEDNENNDSEPNAEVKDRDMGGRVIECLRLKYANSVIQLEPQCQTELVDIIQASKLDVRLDVQLYQACKDIIRNRCPGADKEDCLKVLFQQKKIADKACREQVLRVIKEGKADIHVDSVLLVSCQVDIVKFCNDVPLGKSKSIIIMI
ncbi:hypothetical protein I4U23_009075 [Adineta vaga]|nr:hypothetical protein I4U23_009075 [Adineta vaga]